MKIDPFNPSHLPAVVDLSLRAWAPVFVSIKNAMNEDLYQSFYPDGWRASQQKAVEDACNSPDMHTWVALDDGRVGGFVAVRKHEDELGEIYMIAVDPDLQGRGVGAALTNHALQWMRDAGLPMAMVETGTDPGHAPARRLYESSGFGLWPAARYFKKL